MIIKHLIDEDFVNYKKPSMFICFATCTWKCECEGGAVCQNRQIASLPNVEIEPQTIVDRYMNNSITKAFVMGGLEPLDQIDDVLALIALIRKQTDDDIVIFTGYTEDEINSSLQKIIEMGKHNIIVKVGRYLSNKPNRFDDVLGIHLASNNQYAKNIGGIIIEH